MTQQAEKMKWQRLKFRPESRERYGARNQWCREENKNKTTAEDRKSNSPGLVVSWNEWKEKRPLLLVGSHQWKHASQALTNYRMGQTQQRGKSFFLFVSDCLSDWSSLCLSLSLMTGSITGKLGLGTELQAGSCCKICLTPTTNRKSRNILNQQVNI